MIIIDLFLYQQLRELLKRHLACLSMYTHTYIYICIYILVMGRVLVFGIRVFVVSTVFVVFVLGIGIEFFKANFRYQNRILVNINVYIGAYVPLLQFVNISFEILHSKYCYIISVISEICIL
jgi:hypothetical protein